MKSYFIGDSKVLGQNSVFLVVDKVVKLEIEFRTRENN